MTQPFRTPAVDFKAEKIDAFLVSGAPNVRYLTGFTGSNGLLLVTKDQPLFFTDPRYTIQASQEVACRTKVVPRGALIVEVMKTVGRLRVRRLGFEKSRLSYELYAYLHEHKAANAELVGVGPAIERQRMVKTEAELAAIRTSVLTNSRAFDRILKKIGPKLSEADIAASLEFEMRRLGAEKPSFETIVASGARTALPHAHPTSRRPSDNELLLIDMGASQGGYASDMTRTMHIGRPKPKTKQMYQAVLEAQLAAIDQVREGVTAVSVDRAARQVLKKHGLDQYFTHSTGHGLGLEIHEPPRLGKQDKTLLEAGMAITIEPGAYIEDFGGVRIEDTVVVTRQGCEVLTPTPKEFIIL